MARASRGQQLTYLTDLAIFLRKSNAEITNVKLMLKLVAAVIAIQMLGEGRFV